jgi:hypothetical protein
VAGVVEQREQESKVSVARDGLLTPLTKLPAFFSGVRFPGEGIDPKDHLHLISADLDPPDEGPQHLAWALPCPCIQGLRPLGRPLLHAAQDQLACTLQRRGLGERLTLGFDVRHALTPAGHARLACLLCNAALGLAIDKPCQALAARAPLALEDGTLLPLPLARGVETAGTLLGEACRMRPEGTHVLPHRQRKTIRPSRGGGTEAWAATARGLRASTPVRGLGPRPARARAGPQGCPVAGLAAVLTWAHALEQSASATRRLSGMPAVGLPLLLHRGKHLGGHQGGHRPRKPRGGRDLIVCPGPPWVPWSLALGPEFRAPRAWTRWAQGRAAPRGRMGQHGPDHAALPYGAPRPRPFARPDAPATDGADGEPRAAHPLQAWADAAGVRGEEGIAGLARAVMLPDGAGARGRATEPGDRPPPGRLAFAPAVACDQLGPFVRGQQPLPLEEPIIFRAPPALAVQADALHPVAPQGCDP